MSTGSGTHLPAPARGQVYRALYNATDFCSRQMLAEKCGISIPTLSRYLTELMDAGLIRYSGESRSTGGRRALGLTVVPDARFAVGISVTEQNVRIAAADLRLRELAYRLFSASSSALVAGDAPTLAQLLEGFLDANGLDRDKLLGVGVTLPGIISPDGGKALMAPPLGLYDVPLDNLTRDIPYPVHVENDGSASGYAEWFSRGRSGNMAYISLETGVGGAILLGGVPYVGDHSRSGEFGHICVEPGGLRCSCGKNGCLEAYCSARRIREELDVSLADFFRGLELHAPDHEMLWFDMLRHLAIGINTVHMALDSDVVLGGFLTEYMQPWLPTLKRYVAAGNPLGQNAEFVRLSTLRQNIAPLGAALHFVREFIGKA